MRYVNIYDHADSKVKILEISDSTYEKIIPPVKSVNRPMTSIKPKNFATFVKELGFIDEQEFHKLHASLNLISPNARIERDLWQENDGSKNGLLKLIEKYGTK